MERRRRSSGSLIFEKKALLKKIIMDKAHEEMHKEALKRKAEKESHIKQKIEDLPSMQSMSKGDLVLLCENLHKKICSAENDKYDLEKKLYSLELNVNELQAKIKLKGKFVKPILRRVKSASCTRRRAFSDSKD